MGCSSSSSAASCRGLVRVELEVEVGDERLARALLEAVRPDDETAPPHLRIREEVAGGSLRFTVEGCADPKRIGSVRNTVNEILEYTYAALKAIDAALARSRRGTGRL